MAQLACIGPKLVKANVQAEGDIVGVFEDTHEFSSTELDLFDIVPVAGKAMEVDTEIQSRQATVDPEDKRWTDGEKWYDIKEMPKYRTSVADLSAGQKTALTNKTGVARAAAFNAMADKLVDHTDNKGESKNQLAAEIG